MSKNSRIDAAGNDSEGVERAIRLALLEKNAEEQKRLGEEVEKILAFVSEVQLVTTDNAIQNDGQVNIFRDDRVTVEAGAYRKQMLTQAPATFKQWFLSKKIL